MKKKIFIIILSFISLIILFKVDINAQNLNNYKLKNEVIENFNKKNEIIIDNIYKPINKTYRRTIINSFNKKGMYGGKVDIHYTLYKFIGKDPTSSYYLFFLNALNFPNHTKQKDGNYFINSFFETNIESKGNHIVFFGPHSFNETDKSIKQHYNFDRLSFYNFYNKDLSIDSYRYFDGAFSLRYNYERNKFDYLFNKSSDFMKKPHSLNIYALFRTKNENINFNIKFEGQFNYLYKDNQVFFSTKRVMKV